MILDFLIPGVLQVDMTPYVKSMIDKFPKKLSGKTKGLWNENEGDWKKLVKMMNFFEATKNNIATMSADNLNSIKWYIDVSFAVHKDMSSKEPHWSLNDSWFRCYLIYFYKTKDQYPQFH
jgi:hypothetical protein